MARALTTKAVENLRPGPVRREIADRTPLLYLIVQPGTGRRRFALRYRFDGKSVKWTLPRSLALAEARQAATAAGRDLDKGIDPRAAQRTAKVKAALATADTVLAVCMAYQQRDGGKLRTARQRWRLLERHIFPTFGSRPIGSIRRGEIVRLLDGIADRCGARSADLVLGLLGRVMRWHALRDETFSVPLVAGMARHSIAAHARARVLDDAELRRLWTAAAKGGTFGRYVKFLLLTACRRGEASALTWGEVDDDGVWHLPAARNKTEQPLARPLSGAALAVLNAQPRVVGCPFVFSYGNGPLRSFSRPKDLLDAAAGLTNWRLHDLRRCARTLLSRASVAPDIAEMYLGHRLPIIRRTYDQHRYIDEMRHAAEALAALIERVVDLQLNVVAMPQHG